MTDVKEFGPIDLDTNVNNAVTASFSCLGSTLITAYVIGDTGAHANHRVVIQISPNDGGLSGIDWFRVGDNMDGDKATATYVGAADSVRFKVVTAEGAPSTCKIYAVAI